MIKVRTKPPKVIGKGICVTKEDLPTSSLEFAEDIIMSFSRTSFAIFPFIKSLLTYIISSISRFSCTFAVRRHGILSSVGAASFAAAGKVIPRSKLLTIPILVQHQFPGNLYGHSQSGTKAACKRSSGVRAASFFALAITFPPSEHEAHAQHFSADRPLPLNLQSLPRRFLQGQGDRHNPRWSRRGSSQGQDYRPDSWRSPHE